MRLALAFSATKYLVTAEQRSRFQEGLAELPSEVILYWFTLCFYGYHQSAGRAALRTLLTHEEPKPPSRVTTRRKAPGDLPPDRDLFAAPMVNKPGKDYEKEVADKATETVPAGTKTPAKARGRAKAKSLKSARSPSKKPANKTKKSSSRTAPAE